MPNYLWFFLLAILGLFFIIFSLKNSKIPKAQAVCIFLVMSGMAYAFEYIIFILLGSYEYHVDFFQNQWLDSTFGSIFSQALVVPAICMYIASLRLNVFWMIGFAGLLMGIEELFLRLGLYEHHWWKTPYTGMFLMLAFGIAKWWARMLSLQKSWIRWFNLYFTINLINHSVAFFLTAFFNSHKFNPGWFSDSSRDSLAFEALWWFIHSVPVTFLVQRWFKWYSLFILLVADWMMFMLMEQSGWLVLKHGWNITLFSLLPVGVALSSYLINKIILRKT
ncbi:hypothetical protein AB1K84_06115 [Mesobacillus foraminis]|uniref:hypothetical protein n=1 Tax=Mesobacillus foraminis TaxID=279826 RepID=UPI00399F4A4C